MTEIFCDFCENVQQKKAVVFCSECDQNKIIFLCQECDQKGHFGKIRKKHKRLPISKFKKDKEPKEKDSVANNNNCETHKNCKLKYFCLSCFKVVCKKCILKDHEGHPFQEEEEIFTKILKYLKAEINVKDQELQEAEELKNDLTNETKKFELEKAKLKKAFVDQKLQLQEYLKSKENKELKTTLEPLLNYENELLRSLIKANNLIENTKSTQLLIKKSTKPIQKKGKQDLDNFYGSPFLLKKKREWEEENRICKHGKEIEFYCKSHKLLICQKEKQDNHQNCTLLTIKERTNMLMNKYYHTIEEEANRLKEIRKSNLGVVEKNHQKICKEHSGIINEINNLEKNVFSQFQQLKEKALVMIGNTFSDQLKELSEKKKQNFRISEHCHQMILIKKLIKVAISNEDYLFSLRQLEKLKRLRSSASNYSLPMLPYQSVYEQIIDLNWVQDNFKSWEFFKKISLKNSSICFPKIFQIKNEHTIQIELRDDQNNIYPFNKETNKIDLHAIIIPEQKSRKRAKIQHLDDWHFAGNGRFNATLKLKRLGCYTIECYINGLKLKNLKKNTIKVMPMEISTKKSFLLIPKIIINTNVTQMKFSIPHENTAIIHTEEPNEKITFQIELRNENGIFVKGYDRKIVLFVEPNNDIILGEGVMVQKGVFQYELFGPFATCDYSIYAMIGNLQIPPEPVILRITNKIKFNEWKGEMISYHNTSHTPTNFEDNLKLVTGSEFPKIIAWDDKNEGWIQFSFDTPLEMIETRRFNGAFSSWEIQYSDDQKNWTTVAKHKGTSDWVSVQWEYAGKHQFWRYLLIENPKRPWYQKWEWYYIR
ncbi:tripartite motif-containing 33 [Anaeramoeba flamelloides]|uniref:Tripartite motif-containing 33 n=1 Tax=Anaeramoeba flamelloides TaxID=1746091 RepID=A0ABQ8YL35_9EUKA|nr:tripartite motif-containing 33 [Anaeramoeba flamelloides]